MLETKELQRLSRLCNTEYQRIEQQLRILEFSQEFSPEMAKYLKLYYQKELLETETIINKLKTMRS